MISNIVLYLVKKSNLINILWKNLLKNVQKVDNSRGALSKQAFLEKFLSINTSSNKIKYSLKSIIISCYNCGIITFKKRQNIYTWSSCW